MSLRVAVQMDPLESVDIHGDTTFALMETAQARGAKLWSYHPDDLAYDDGRVIAHARPTQVQRVPAEPGVFGEAARIDLGADVDVVLMRQDPPYDMAYITAAHLLELITAETLVLNDPAWVRSSPEKLLPLDFPELIAPTLVARSMTALRAFRERHGDIIIKPLYGNGGAGVFRLRPDDGNFNALIEMFHERNREPVMAQAFLPAVSKGDKRVILIDGEPVGAINRVPQKGETRSNMHVGGVAEPAELDADDLRICAAIGPTLRERGLVLAGIDVIGGRLTEINTTSPTGIQELKRFSGVDAAALFWDAAVRRLEAFR